MSIVSITNPKKMCLVVWVRRIVKFHSLIRRGLKEKRLHVFSL